MIFWLDWQIMIDVSTEMDSQRVESRRLVLFIGADTLHHVTADLPHQRRAHTLGDVEFLINSDPILLQINQL